MRNTRCPACGERVILIEEGREDVALIERGNVTHYCCDAPASLWNRRVPLWLSVLSALIAVSASDLWTYAAPPPWLKRAGPETRDEREREPDNLTVESFDIGRGWLQVDIDGLGGHSIDRVAVVGSSLYVIWREKGKLK